MNFISHTYHKTRLFWIGVSNKNLSWIIFLLILFSGFGIYYNFFVYNVGNLEIKSDVSGFEINLKYKGQIIGKTFCEGFICEIEKVSPLEYEILITKEGYKDFSENFLMTKKGFVSLEINLDKNMIFENISNFAFENNLRISKTGNNYIFYLKEEIIGTISLENLNNSNILISRIYSDEENYLVKIGNREFFVNSFGQISEVKIGEFNYIKKSFGNYFILKNDGVYSSSNLQNLSKVSNEKDYLKLENGFIEKTAEKFIFTNNLGEKIEFGENYLNYNYLFLYDSEIIISNGNNFVKVLEF